jgi:queuosine precursor transporter
MLKNRKEIVFVVLAGIFITSAIVAELISCKQVDIGLFPIIAGIVPWPVVFLLTDVMNEFYGRQAVRRLSWITCVMIAFCFLMVFIAVKLPATETSLATQDEFAKLFGGSLPIMIGSISAFIVSQMIDVRLFWFFRRLTGDKYIWLRSTGSTVISQLADSYIVLLIGFWLPGVYSLEQIAFFGITGYATKLVIAICLTPLIYAVRGAMRSIFGKELAEQLSDEAARESTSY